LLLSHQKNLKTRVLDGALVDVGSFKLKKKGGNFMTDANFFLFNQAINNLGE
jgi:hypothetical protein